MKGFKSGRKKEVLLLRPNDHRASTLHVERETDVGLQCGRMDGIAWRIFKHGPAWSFPKTDTFLAIEGDPVTSYVGTDKDIKNASISEFLRFAWGEKPYERLPPELKEPLEGKWGATVTVKPTKIDEDLGFDKIKAAAILKEHTIGMMEDFAISEPKKDKIKDLLSYLVPILLGFLGGVVAVSKGWF